MNPEIEVIPRGDYINAKLANGIFHGSRKKGSKWDAVVSRVRSIDTRYVLRLRRLNHGESAALRANAIARGIEITVSSVGDFTYVMRR